MHADVLLQRFHDPQYAGDIDAPDGFGADGNVTCGDVVNLAIKVSDGLIIDARFRTRGCAVAIAASDAVCELVIGSTWTSAQMIGPEDLAQGLGEVPDEREQCVAITLRALRQALAQLPSKSERT